jgi:hypothetical protein
MEGVDGMTGVLYVPELRQGRVALKITQTNLNLAASRTAGGYTLYGGSETISKCSECGGGGQSWKFVESDGEDGAF